MAAFERYVKWVPGDAEAKRGLAGAYRGAGQVDKAQAIEKELVASGASAGGAAGGAAGSSAVNRRHGVDQRNELGDVVVFAAGRRHDQTCRTGHRRAGESPAGARLEGG